MSLRVGIRRAKLEDVPQVFALQQAIPEAPHWTEAAYLEFVERLSDAIQHKVLLIAADEERLYGFAAASALELEAELESIAVTVDARRSGLGRALLDAAMSWAEAEGAENLRLEVRAANVSAQTFYKAKGFRHEGLRRGYYQNPVDDGVLMLRQLTARPGT